MSENFLHFKIIEKEVNRKLIYENIEAIAKKKRISIRQLEIKAELSSGTICKWKKCNPTVGNLAAVAKVLGVSVTTLMKGAV